MWCEVMWLNWRHYELRLVWGQDLGYSCLTSVQLSPAKNPGPGPVSACSMGLARKSVSVRYFPNICGGFKLSLCWSKHFSVMACNRYHHRTPRGTATATITPSPQYNTQHIIMAAVVHVATDNCKKMDSVPQRFYSRLWRPLGNQRC